MWLHLNVDYEPIALLGKKNEVSEVYAVSRMKPVYLQRKYKGKEDKINIVGSWKKYCNNNISSRVKKGRRLGRNNVPVTTWVVSVFLR